MKNQQIENRKNAGLDKLFSFTNKQTLVNESEVISALKQMGKKYYGAIDSEDQNDMQLHYGISFEPSRNSGDNMWLVSVI